MPYNELQKGRFSEHGRAYFITTRLADLNSRYFIDFYCARLLIAEMRLLHDSGAVNSLAWVVMPDHLHWLFQLGDIQPLSTVIKQLKARSSHRINLRLNRQGALWQPGFHDHALRREDNIQNIARYIIANPLRAGLVDKLGNYPHWDAIWAYQT